jgi:hypothetical protein
MARQSPAQKLARLITVTQAWQRLRANRSYAGMTLAEFKRGVQPSHDWRVEIAALQKQLREAIECRELADRDSLRLLRRVAAGVLSDPDEGPDSELYGAMGYVRESTRRARRSRRAARSSNRRSRR